MQLNLSTVATLGTEESGCCRKALNKSQCMDLLSARTKKLAFVERWPLVEVRLYSGGGGGTLGISGWGCAAGTVEPLTYTRASSAEFCYPILE